MNKTFLILCLVLGTILGSLNSLTAQETFGYPVGGSTVTANCYFGNSCAGTAGTQHTGVDFSRLNGTTIVAAASGKVHYIMLLEGNDHGLGNVVILQHRLSNGSIRYSLYAHLNSINTDVFVGKVVNKGDALGVMGASGYDCPTYWCNTGCTAPVGCSNTHLHFEIKTEGILNNPCGSGSHWGYTPGNPANYCYENPFNYIDNNGVQVLPHPVNVYPTSNATGIPQNPTIDWASVTGATNYRIQVKVGTSSGWTAEDGFTTSTVTSAAIPVNNATGTTSQFTAALNPNTTYYWTVRVANGSTSSFYSPPIAFTTAPVACGTPTDITHSNITATSAQINWFGNATNTSSITLEYSPNGSAWVVQTLPAGYSYYVISGLNAGSVYYYRLKRNCTSGGSSPYSTVGSFTTAAPPTTCGNSTLTAPSGTFSDGSGAANYVNNLNCSWLIQLPGATAITISFSAFATEANYDFVKIYQGTSAAGLLKASFSGTTLPATITISGGSVFVLFTSDNSNTAAGWNASYSSSALNSTGIYKLTHKGTNQCLDVANNLATPGTNVQQWTDNGNDAQRWVVSLQADGYYKLTHKGTNQCLEVINNSSVPGANVQQWTDNGNDAQRWGISLEPDGYYKLVHKGTNQCLDVANNSALPGANVQQWTDNGNDAQRWQMTFMGYSLQDEAAERGLSTRENLSAPGLTILPNPTDGEVQLTFDDDLLQGEATVLIIDLNGRVVDTIFSGASTQLTGGLVYRTSHLATGNYQVVFSSKTGQQSKQLVIVR